MIINANKGDLRDYDGREISTDVKLHIIPSIKKQFLEHFFLLTYNT